MTQIAVDSQGNKIRWDETKKEWIPVERWDGLVLFEATWQCGRTMLH